MWVLELPLIVVALVFTGYLAVVAAAAIGARPAARRGHSEPPRHHFAVVIPSHNEATTLPTLLGALGDLDYPRPRYEVIVIADNCDDETARVARAYGARVLERVDPPRRSEGDALGWAFAQLVPERRHDAFVILDADSRPAPDVLTELDAALRAGAQVAQAYCAVGNADEGWRAALMAADLALTHYLRPLGRQALGASAGLQGNGICLTRRVLREVPWETASVAEDHEYHLALLLHGVGSVFVPHAVVETGMDPTMATARSQELGWEDGRFGLARRAAGPLIRKALGLDRRSSRERWVYLDAALDLAMPPFALLAAGTAGMMSLHGLAWLAGGAPVLTFLWAAMLAAQAFYVFAGCALAGLPPRVYAALFVCGPLYATARVWYCLLGAWGGAREWVSTPRKAARQKAA